MDMNMIIFIILRWRESEADWLVGINATRLFTVLYHHRLIVGRVQTPTLAMLVEREKSIENFQKEKYYLVHLLMDGLDAVSNRIKEKSAAVQMMEDMKDETAQILSVKKEKKKVQPPKLYDLTTLQREANRHFWIYGTANLGLYPKPL